MYRLEFKGVNEVKWIPDVTCDSLRETQDRVMNPAKSCLEFNQRILRDGIEVARWEPASGWRYFRTAEAIVEWYQACDSSRTSPFVLFLSFACNLDGYKGRSLQDILKEQHNLDAANAWFDAQGLLLPEGAIPPRSFGGHEAINAAIDKVPQPQTYGWTPAEIVVWFKTGGAITYDFQHWSNRNGRQWCGMSEPCRGYMSFLQWLDKNFHAACAWLHDHGITAPSEFSAEEIVAWLDENKHNPCLLNPNCELRSDLRKIECEMYGNSITWPTTFKQLRTNPAYLAAVQELLAKHNIDVRNGVTTKEEKAMVQRSPIFGIKLPCGSCVGFQKLEDGTIVWRTSGTALDGQKKGGYDVNQLAGALTRAENWQPDTAKLDEWRFI